MDIAGHIVFRSATSLTHINRRHRVICVSSMFLARGFQQWRPRSFRYLLCTWSNFEIFGNPACFIVDVQTRGNKLGHFLDSFVSHVNSKHPCRLVWVAVVNLFEKENSAIVLEAQLG